MVAQTRVLGSDGYMHNYITYHYQCKHDMEQMAINGNVGEKS